MTPLVAYLLLFVAVGVGFIFVHLVAGKLIRPNNPGTEKQTIYECGEPTIGSAWIQFDLRFYVVALLFVIFDVEVAFFFPWAEVFGKANAIAADQTPPSDFASMKAYSLRTMELAQDAPEGMSATLFRYLSSMSLKDFEQLKAIAIAAPTELPAAHAASQNALASLPNTPENGGIRRAHQVILALDNAQQWKDLRDKDKLATVLFPDSVDTTMREVFRLVATMNAAEYDEFRKLAGTDTELRKLKVDIRKQLAALPDSPDSAVAHMGMLAILALNSDMQLQALKEKGVPLTDVKFRENHDYARSLSLAALGEIVVFFGVLLVGFAYLWKRGDLAWVRSLQAERQAAIQLSRPRAEPTTATAELAGAGTPAAHH